MQGAGGQFRDLMVWKKARELSVAVYRLTASFPADERFGLTQQLRRAAVSVPSNIAEGWGRSTTSDYLRFLGMARGSLYEVDTQISIAEDLGFTCSASAIQQLVAEVERLLNALIRSLNHKLRDT